MHRKITLFLPPARPHRRRRRTAGEDESRDHIMQAHLRDSDILEEPRRDEPFGQQESRPRSQTRILLPALLGFSGRGGDHLVRRIRVRC